LERDPNRRFRDAADVRIELEESLAGPAAFESPRARTPRTLVASLVFACLAIGWGLAYVWFAKVNSDARITQPTYSHIAAPSGTVSAFHHGFALSPDGQTLVFSALTEDGRRQLWKRRLDNPVSQAIAGTEDAMQPFWSPDGNHIAFFVPGELRRIAAGGGQVRPICNISGFHGQGSWGDSGEILFPMTRGIKTSIFRVSAEGGSPQEFTGLGNGQIFSPQWLPKSSSFLFCRIDENRFQHICVASADGSLSPRQIIQTEMGYGSAGIGFFFSQPGYLFFNRAGSLFVQRFDIKSATVVGRAVQIAGLAGSPHDCFALSAVSDKVAVLARVSMNDSGNPGDPLASLKWLNRAGEVVGTLGLPRRYWYLRLSPDGTRAAVNPDDDIWILDFGIRSTHLTLNPAINYSAVWSSDGKRIAFGRGAKSLLVKSASQGGDETELVNNRNLSPADWSPDNRYLLLENLGGAGLSNYEISYYDFKDKSVKKLLESKFIMMGARFSPDGKWVAYASNENGVMDVYIRSFFNVDDNPIPVSSGGGNHPAWRGNGKELFYLNPNNELMVVAVENLGTILKVSEARRLFKMALNDITITATPPYDVYPDGQRFLVNMLEPPEPLLFIQGIDKLVKRGQ
jgi:Tol biopolymer transport system component